MKITPHITSAKLRFKDLLRTNEVLARNGVHSFSEFLALLRPYLTAIPELQQVTDAGARVGVGAVLSGGSARAVMVQFLKDLDASGKEKLRPACSLFEMLEGSDVDVLVFPLKGNKIAPDAVVSLSDALNRISGARLVAPLPALERRMYSVEWDIVDVNEFARLNKAFGGDTTSLFGLGLDTHGELTAYDPYDALPKLFQGTFSYVKGKSPYDHEMVVQGKFDPSLDGLRIIRMAGQMQQVGVVPDEQATQALHDLGKEANRRAWEVEARIKNSPDNKLARRWPKYVTKIWSDHADPQYASQLLQASGYTQLLTKLGMREHLLQRLPTQRQSELVASPQAQAFVRAHRQAFAKVWKSKTEVASLPLFTWQPRTLAHAMTQDKKFFGQAGPYDHVALTVSQGRTMPAGGLVSQGVRIELVNDARVLDAARVHELVTQFANASAGDELLTWTQSALALGVALGADVVVGDGIATILNERCIKSAVTERGILEGVVEDLEMGRAGARTEGHVRALLAVRGKAGLDDLQKLMEQGKVTLAHLFPADAQEGGLFADVPHVSKPFGDFLESLLGKTPGLSESQKRNVRAAAVFIRGDLPEEYLLGGA